MNKKNISETDSEDFHLASKEVGTSLDYYESFLKFKQVIESIPTKIVKNESPTSLYSLFKEVNSARHGNTVLYRKLGNADESLCTLWLSRIHAGANLLASYNSMPKFSELTPEAMVRLSKLSVDIDNLLKLPSILFEFGIILIYERALPGMKLDGTVFMSHTGNPVIGLSLRYPRLDNFWFTLMHELAHIALHADTLSTPILDNLDAPSTELTERQADRLALESFVPRSAWRNCKPKYDHKKSSVLEFAEKMNIHPAIVAGRLSRELERYELFSDVRNSVNVREVIFGHD